MNGPQLTRRRVPDVPREVWEVWYGDVRVGSIGERAGAPKHQPPWQWYCGFYPGSEPNEHRSGVAESFEAARAAFQSAWEAFLPKRKPADFEEWRRQQAWTAEKYARWDRGER